MESMSRISNFEDNLMAAWTSKAPNMMAVIPKMMDMRVMILGTSEVQVQTVESMPEIREAPRSLFPVS